MAGDNLYRQLDAYIEAHLGQWLAELSTLCSQPSVSAQGLGIRECAELVAAMLRRRGLAVEIHQTPGNPIVTAEAPGRADRTLLFYNHYDVQPPEPLELWHSPPFRPTLREGKLFARGVSDDKGHIICRLAALDALRAVLGEFPCRIKFVIEGEEETSSGSLPGFLAAHREDLAADACLWEFGGVNDEGAPLNFAGMRGICYVELRARTASQDAHSGTGGSIFPNAAWRLTWALASLKGPDEEIRIPGFYENVAAPTARDLELLGALPDEGEALKRHYGLRGFLKGITGGVELRCEKVFRPTCTICGLTAGYQGPGAKTVLPAEASAKVDFRLVPHQTPEEIVKKLRAHLAREGFEEIEVVPLGGEAPGRVDPDHPFLRLIAECARGIYEQEVLLEPIVGGTGPIHAFLEHLRVPIGTTGVGYPGAGVHAPNENLRTDLFARGIRHTARVVERFARE